MGDEAEVENLATILSQNSLDEETGGNANRKGLFFSDFFFTVVDFRPSKPKLQKVVKTSRGGASYHFEQIVSGETRYFEMLCESVSANHINLVCANRPKCKAREHLPVIGTEVQIVKREKKYRLQGAEVDILKVANYGQLFHVHSAKCKG